MPHKIWGPLVALIYAKFIFTQESTNRQRPPPAQIRWCAKGRQQLALCQEMAQQVGGADMATISCFEAKNDWECMQSIKNNMADLVNFEAEKIYIAGKYFDMRPILFERVDNSSVFSDDVVVVVKKLHYYAEGLQNLHLKRLCLSGADDHNLQYQALVNVLFPLGLATVYHQQCGSTIPSLANYFSDSCVPGEWSLDENLKNKFGGKLCKLCKSGCTQQDYFAGVDGAIRCLINNQADVAVTSTKALQRANLDPKAYQVLCIQGTRKNLTKSCEWTGRRTNALMVSAGSSGQTSENWKKSLLRIVDKFGSKFAKRPDWLNRLIFSGPNVQRLEDVYYHNTYERYLGLVFARSMAGTHPFSKLDCAPSRSWRWCLPVKATDAKCRQMGVAWESQRLKPHLTCVVASSVEECADWTRRGVTDVTMMRPDEAFKGFVSNDLAIVGQERYSDNADSSLFGLAVVKKGSKVTLSSLLGSKSCHPSADDVIGWYGPLILLEKRGMLNIQNCDYAMSAGGFFWESCVPEISTYGKHKQGNYENLCALCGGISNCAWNSTLAGYKGALKCLAKTDAQVAFVSNETLLSGDWELADQLFELLCPDNTRASVLHYAKCHWLKIPPKVIVVSRKNLQEDDRRKLTQNLMKAQTYFGSISNQDQKDGGHFSMFSTPDDPTTIFTPQTVALRPIWPENGVSEIFGEDYSLIYDKLVKCYGLPLAASTYVLFIACFLLLYQTVGFLL